MTGPVFVDTNVYVYRFDTTEPEKQRRCEAWLRHLWRERSGRVSIQVLQELYPNLTRKLDHPLSPAEARGIVRSLYAWDPVPVDRRTIEFAWNLQDRHSLSWWDALIVAAAQAAGCPYLLTEDLNHDQDLDGVRVVDPFRVEPTDLGS
jgi:predicted nucleic acid-binding protein